MQSIRIFLTFTLALLLITSSALAAVVVEYIPDSTTTTSGTTSSTSSSSSSSSGGGGGGGGGSSTVSERDTIVGSVQEGTFEYSQETDTLGVFQIDATFSKEERNPSMTVQEAFISSTSTQPAGPGEVLFTAVTFFRENIQEVTQAKVWFKVKKSDVIRERVNPEAITIKRRSSDGWLVLPTVFEEEEREHYLYSAQINGISTLALVGTVRDENIVDALVAPETPTSNQPEPESLADVVADFFELPEELENEPPLSPKRGLFAIRFVLAGLLIIILLALFVELLIKVNARMKNKQEMQQLDSEIDQELRR